MNQTEFALRVIRYHRHKLTRQQIRTLCGQAKSGDPYSALKGLKSIIERVNKKNG